MRILCGLFRERLAIYAGMKPQERVEILLRLLDGVQRVTMAERDNGGVGIVMAYEKAAVRHARVMREARERKEQDDRARIAEVVAEFDGDAAKMAEEILYWRRRMKQLFEIMTKIESREPFTILPVGPLWQPGERGPGWWR